MNGTPPLEAFLAQLYADPAVLARYLAAPEQTMAAAGLSAEDAAAMRQADHTGIVMAARSYTSKRERRRKARHPQRSEGV
jgi:hypothetical protein